jgi:transcriptional regulator with XRE-family HTH domain
MTKKKSGRGIVLSREALQNARKIERNMTQEDLANAVRTDVRVIQRAEAEKPIEVAYAHQIAHVLGKELSELVKEDTPTTADPLPKQPESPQATIPVDTPIVHAVEKLFSAIVFAGDCKPPIRDAALKKLAELALLLKMEDGYNDNDVSAISGSLVILVPLSRRDTAKLMNAFIAGELEQFNVSSITLFNFPSSETEDTSQFLDDLLFHQQLSPKIFKQLSDAALRRRSSTRTETTQ